MPTKFTADSATVTSSKSKLLLWPKMCSRIKISQLKFSSHLFKGKYRLRLKPQIHIRASILNLSSDKWSLTLWPSLQITNASPLNRWQLLLRIALSLAKKSSRKQISSPLPSKCLSIIYLYCLLSSWLKVLRLNSRPTQPIPSSCRAFHRQRR